jgi:hypothetical protein
MEEKIGMVVAKKVEYRITHRNGRIPKKLSYIEDTLSDWLKRYDDNMALNARRT